jgi:hypothetical protein
MGSTAFAFESVREQEMAQCLPGEIATWGDGQDRPATATRLHFTYSHAGAPSWFSEATVFAAVQNAVAAWSACGIASVVELQTEPASRQGDAISVRWGDPYSAGNFGLADLTRRTLSLGPAAFQMLRTRNPAHDAQQTLQMVISHEMGHHFGLMAHSRRCIDVTSYYNNGRGEQCFARDIKLLRSVPEYRASLPTACDIQRCRIANGLKP